jgi:hypothetical protein
MAQIQVQLHWDGKKVEKSYQLLSTEPKDTILFVTGDPDPFIIKTTNAALAKKLGLRKVKSTGGLNDLYQVKKVNLLIKKDPPPVKNAIAPWRKLECGTIAQRQYKKWGGVDPPLARRRQGRSQP